MLTGITLTQVLILLLIIYFFRLSSTFMFLKQGPYFILYILGPHTPIAVALTGTQFPSVIDGVVLASGRSIHVTRYRQNMKRKMRLELFYY